MLEKTVTDWSCWGIKWTWLIQLFKNLYFLHLQHNDIAMNYILNNKVTSSQIPQIHCTVLQESISRPVMFHTRLIFASKLICTYFQSNSTPRAPNHSGSILHIKTKFPIWHQWSNITKSKRIYYHKINVINQQ